MDRRSFLRMIGLAPVAGVASASAPPSVPAKGIVYDDSVVLIDAIRWAKGMEEQIDIQAAIRSAEQTAERVERELIAA
mgnify:CR=1 FL=1